MHSPSLDQALECAKHGDFVQAVDLLNDACSGNGENASETQDSERSMAHELGTAMVPAMSLLLSKILNEGVLPSEADAENCLCFVRVLRRAVSRCGSAGLECLIRIIYFAGALHACGDSVRALTLLSELRVPTSYGGANMTLRAIKQISSLTGDKDSEIENLEWVRTRLQELHEAGEPVWMWKDIGEFAEHHASIGLVTEAALLYEFVVEYIFEFNKRFIENQDNYLNNWGRYAT